MKCEARRSGSILVNYRDIQPESEKSECNSTSSSITISGRLRRLHPSIPAKQNCSHFSSQAYGFDSNTDCCYVPILGDEDFCTSEYLCGADEGDCDFDEECQSELFCGSNNCPNSLGVSTMLDCCEPQGKLLLNCNALFG